MGLLGALFTYRFLQRAASSYVCTAGLVSNKFVSLGISSAALWLYQLSCGVDSRSPIMPLRVAALFSVVESKFESQGTSAYATLVINDVMSANVRAKIREKYLNFLFIPEHPPLNFNPLAIVPSEN